jgi:hypothetical protein
MRVPPGPCELGSPFVVQGYRREPPRQLASALRSVGWTFGKTRKHDRIELVRNRLVRARGRRLWNRLRVLEEELHRRVREPGKAFTDAERYGCAASSFKTSITTPNRIRRSWQECHRQISRRLKQARRAGGEEQSETRPRHGFAPDGGRG